MTLVAVSLAGENQEMASRSKTIDTIIAVVVGLLLIGYVGPTAIQSMVNATGFNTNASVGSTTLSTLFSTVLPVLAVIVFLLVVVDMLRHRKK